MAVRSVETRDLTCWCGCPFSCPKEYYEQHLKNRTVLIYCPYGHTVRYGGDTEADVLRRERDRLKQNEARLEQEILELERKRVAAERKTKSVIKRAQAAMCPCCNRHFNNVEAHMKTAHPDIAKLPERKIP